MPKQIGDIIVFPLKEISEKLDITTVTLRKYIRQGKLIARKWGGNWYVSEDSLREFFNTAPGKKSSRKKKP